MDYKYTINIRIHVILFAITVWKLLMIKSGAYFVNLFTDIDTQAFKYDLDGVEDQQIKTSWVKTWDLP